jgi:hypothetical protein
MSELGTSDVPTGSDDTVLGGDADLARLLGDVAFWPKTDMSEHFMLQ